MTRPMPVPRRRGLQSVPAQEQHKVHAAYLELGRRLLAVHGRSAARRGPADEACGRVAARLVPSAEGRIEQLLVTVPKYEDPAGELVVDPWLRDHLFAVIGQLGARVRYTVVCHLEQEVEVRWWFEQLEIPDGQLDLVLSKYDYSVWAQDAYIALLTDDDRAALCEGVLFLREEDMVIADDVAAQTDVRLLHSILEFQGGNLLGGLESHFVGRDYVEWNIGRRRLETPELVVAEFERLLGGPVEVLGLDEMIPPDDRLGYPSGDWQPIFHLDMYVTRSGVRRDGREVVLVGSPREARRLLGECERAEDRDDRFDQACEQLRELGYAVERLPLLPVRAAPIGWPEQSYVLTWNNVVLEVYQDAAAGTETRRVLLPTYADPENRLGLDQEPRKILDAAATKAWENLGFDVLWVDRMEDLAYGAGSVHCITKVLRRGRVKRE